jgi:indolepyruvate ferredoxin oxidoreductase
MGPARRLPCPQERSLTTGEQRPALREASLDDKYTLESGHAFMTGIQALVRLPMMQRRLDVAAGHDTAGFVSGYRGSPLGGLDQQAAQARALLEAHQVRFQPGVNEDLAATAVWGTQQAGLSGEGAYDGVFAMWYGKGPGVDRSGDAFRHGNLAGTAALGGVLVLLGDDHIAESSTTAHQSELAMVDAQIPVLNPAGVQEILDFGLHGWAMSRYSGCWVALKCIHDTVESAASVEVAPDRVRPLTPAGHALPAGGLNIRWPDPWLDQEARLHGPKLDAVRAYCRANRLDRVVLDSPAPRVGIVTTGKSYLDVCQALDDLGVDAAAGARLGLRLYKVAMPWPLEPEGAREACAGLDVVMVVEEKRGLLEGQLKELLYGVAGAPVIVGKRDRAGDVLFPSAGRLDPVRIAVAAGRELLAAGEDEALRRRVERLAQVAGDDAVAPPAMERTPYFCPGCPHNTSTRVPEGSHALAGIGCHYMAQWMDRDNARYTQMGGEGASWVGEAPFSKRAHVFQNVGDGTYFHSGLLAIRAAIAAGVNITFKVLYNDAVAMTGGQGVDGPLDVPMVTRQVHAEGARRVVVVTDEPDKYAGVHGLAPGTSVHHRDELDAVQRELREIEGTTVLVYDQTCAAEKRRRRKRGLFPDPPKRVFINPLVCEGCGDCGVQSNCVAVVPLETELGRKRAIDQSACNKDFSCLKGFCPSFVTVHGATVRRARGVAAASGDWPALPEPAPPPLERPFDIVVTGVGGTGVVTIGALLGMAAHLEGKGCSVLDMMGLAQKGGAVLSHLRIGAEPGAITATRVAPGSADLLLGCDLMVAAGRESLRTVGEGRTRVVLNDHEVMIGDFTRNRDLLYPGSALRRGVEARAGADAVEVLDATRLATRLLGDAIATNLFLLGYAYQKGLVPVSAAALERAIELNGVAVEMNVQAFAWGRRAAHDRARVEAAARGEQAPRSAEPLDSAEAPEPLEALVEQRAAFLTGYQDAAYARRYRELVERVRAVERERGQGLAGLAEAVARGYFRLLAYKDEYEVARLFTDGTFEAQLRDVFEGEFRVEYHMAPPFLARRDPVTGHLLKRAFGPWLLRAMRGLARLRRLRGTALDPFGYTEERRTERALIGEYEAAVATLLEALSPANHALALELASLPESIRGFGHVKAAAVAEARARAAELLGAVHDARAPSAAA